jgi:MAF protein
VVATARSVAAKDEPSLILASASPRRRQILTTIGLPFQASPVDLDERPLADECPEETAVRLARLKAETAARVFPGQVALGADTVVAVGDEAIGKPTTPEQATAMLRRLRHDEHRVITAVAASRWQPSSPPPQTWQRCATTTVWMRPYSDQEIAKYVASGDPFDKAGAYAIQHPGFHPVARLDGCFLTVVGLALPDVYAVLTEAGVDVPTLARDILDTLCPGCRDLDRLPIRGE